MNFLKGSNVLFYQYYHNEPHISRAVKTGYNYHDFSKSSVQAYAEKYDYSYLLIEKQIPVSPFYGIFLPFTEKWCHEYDAVCFFDSDIMITSHARDLIEFCSDSYISAHLMKNKKIGGKMYEQLDFFRQNGFVNSGVVCFPRNVYTFMENYLSDIEQLHSTLGPMHEYIGGLDQAIINFMLKNELNWNLCDLDKSFNYNMSRYPYSRRFVNDVLHYHRTFKQYMYTDFNTDIILKHDRMKTQLRGNPNRNIDGRIHDNRYAIKQETFEDKHAVKQDISDNHLMSILWNETETKELQLKERHFFFTHNSYSSDKQIKIETDFYNQELAPYIQSGKTKYQVGLNCTLDLPSKYLLLILPKDRKSSEMSIKHVVQCAKLIASEMKLLLLVKPHPKNFNRNTETFLQQNNCKIVHHDLGSLLRNANGVLVTNSYAGIESMIYMKKTIVFDDSNFQFGCHRYSDLISAIQYLKEPFNKNYTISFLYHYFNEFIGIQYEK